MKILNLYAGIGGNRKLWQGHKVTSVEYNPDIAATYEKMYRHCGDNIIVADAHQFLLDHHREYDFIWSSPPCPTHSRVSTGLYGWGIYRYPDMALYQEIIFLRQFFKGKWVVENVIPYYKPLIEPSVTIDRHHFWSNFHIEKLDTPKRSRSVTESTKEQLSEQHGIILPSGTRDVRKLLRNAVNPLIGKHILDQLTK